jgi:hypothetical protein
MSRIVHLNKQRSDGLLDTYKQRFIQKMRAAVFSYTLVLDCTASLLKYYRVPAVFRQLRSGCLFRKRLLAVPV